MSDQNFKVKHGIAITGSSQDTLLTSDDNGNLIVNGSSISITTSSTILNTTSATVIDSIGATTFTSSEYTMSIVQGTKIRTSKILLQTDGISVDMVEFGILTTNGIMTGIAVSSAINAGNVELSLIITDADSTNATVKLIRNLI